jgi:hypothetical protein
LNSESAAAAHGEHNWSAVEDFGSRTIVTLGSIVPSDGEGRGAPQSDTGENKTYRTKESTAKKGAHG